MFCHYRSLGFVIRKENKREADQLFTVFTKDFGKIKILAKSIRKNKSKLRSQIELFYLSEVEFIQGKTNKILVDAVLEDNFLNIKKDFDRIFIAHKIAKVVQELIQGEEKDEKIWMLLNECFKLLDRGQQEQLKNKEEIVYYYFFWKLVLILGYRPKLKDDLLSHRSAKKFDYGTIGLVEQFIEKDFNYLSKINFKENDLNSLKVATSYYSKRILEQIT